MRARTSAARAIATRASGRVARARGTRGCGRAAAGRCVVARAGASARAVRRASSGDADEGVVGASGEAVVAACACAAYAAAAEASAAWAGIYDSVGVPDDQATPLQNLFGLLFTGFSLWYFARAVTRRSGKAREFRVANRLPEEERKKIDEERSKKTKELTAMQSFTGGVTGIGISIVLYLFASKISASFDGKSLPESETVRQISITVRTIVEGLAYLATFVYAANGVGLIALAGQKAMDYANGKDLIDDASAARDEPNEN